MVEAAIVAPLLFLVLFAIIDFGWAFAQNLDVKSAGREGARVAAVNGGQTPGGCALPCTTGRLNDLVAKIRARSTELDDDKTEVFVAFAHPDGTPMSDGDAQAAAVGDAEVVVCVRYPLRSISGVTTSFLSGHLTTKVVMRMEKKPDFASGGSTNPAWGGGTCAAG